ncbi:hypothetical protein C8255_25375 [filamentous cyanobacterium CCP3]|nr:hypothetical protein C8255_25375 [filamentous cyanobacterium CCP3]
MEETGGAIRAYGGFLPGLESTARHILRCEHLEHVSSDGFSPYRAESHLTHQIWIWYRFTHSPQRLNLLFRGQFDFSRPGLDANSLAGRVSDYLAELLMHSKTTREQLFLNDSSWKFWALAIDSFVSTEDKLYGLIDRKKPQTPGEEETYLTVRALKNQAHSLSSVLINQMFSNILMARKISRREQRILMDMLSESDLSDEHQRMIKRLFDEIIRGSVKVVTH